MSNYNFIIKDEIAKGVLPDGTPFLIDSDKVELVNKFCFHLNWKGYIYTLTQKGFDNIRLHWLVLGYKSKPPFIIDHINRDKTDCRLCNLRIVTNQQNSMNRGLGKNNRSGYRGASYSKSNKKYLGRICINNKRIILYKSDNIVECAQAFNYGAKLLFKEYAGYLNDVPDASEEIKQEVYKRCEPYLYDSYVATNQVAISLSKKENFVNG